MTDLISLGCAEGWLCGHLAAALSTFVSGGKRGSAVYNTDMTDWMAAQEALHQIWVMDREPASRRTVLALNAEDMPRLLAETIGAGDPRIPDLISAFIAIVCGYGPDETLSDERDWFEPPARWLASMKWLARTGYAERRGGEFRWTEQIAPAMRASYYWTEDHQSVSALAEIEQQAEAERAWQTMPDTLRQALLSDRLPFLELVKALALYWRGGAWQKCRRDELRLAGESILAADIVKLARASRTVTR